jgi:plastocyanin
MRNTILTAGFIFALCTVCSTQLSAQGNITGQITIQERPGEVTLDLGNTVIYLEPIDAPKTKVKGMKTEMAMQGRQFSPRVRVVPTGSRIEFPNQDPYSHNIFSNAKSGSFDLGLYGRGGSKGANFKTPGMYPIYCNIHSRMTGYVIAVNSPYYAQPGADGRFTINKVPPGKYKINFWHDRAADTSREIIVTASGLSNVNATLDARGYKFVTHKNKFGQDYSTSGDRY